MILTLENLHEYTTEEGDCMLWKLGKNGNGFPVATFDGKRGQSVRVHIAKLKGTYIAGRQASVTCGCRACVNPAHIVMSTPGQVLRRAYQLGARGPASDAAGRIRGRAKNKGLSPVITQQEREVILSMRQKPVAEIAAAIGRGKTAVRSVLTKHQPLANGASVFGWRP